MAKNLEMAILFDVYGDMLTEKQNSTLNMYYNEDLSLTEIAENNGITRQGVHNCITGAEEYLRQLEQTLGCVERFRIIYDSADEIGRLIDTAVDKESSEYAIIKRHLENIKTQL